MTNQCYTQSAKDVLCQVTFCIRVTVLEIFYVESIQILLGSAFLFCTIAYTQAVAVSKAAVH